MVLKGWFVGQDRDMVQGLATLGNILFYWFLILDVIIVFLVWGTEMIERHHCCLQNCCFVVLGEERIICMYICMYTYFFIISGPMCTCLKICNHIQPLKYIRMIFPWNKLYSIEEFCFSDRKVTLTGYLTWFLKIHSLSFLTEYCFFVSDMLRSLRHRLLFW